VARGPAARNAWPAAPARQPLVDIVAARTRSRAARAKVHNPRSRARIWCHRQPVAVVTGVIANVTARLSDAAFPSMPAAFCFSVATAPCRRR